MVHFVAIVAFTLLAAGSIATVPALAAGGEGCPNEQVRQESNVNPAMGEPYSAGLPECRAYEMVSPPEKNNGGIHSYAAAIPAAADGEAVGFMSQNAFGDAENYQNAGLGEPANPFIARRTASGWVTSSALPPRGMIGNTDIGLRPLDGSPSDLSSTATCGLTVVDNATSGTDAVCALREPDGTWLPTPDYSSSTGNYYAANDDGLTFPYLGGSSDLSDVFFESESSSGFGAQFLPADTSGVGGDGLYEVAGLGGSSPQLRLVNVDNSGNEIGPEMGTRIGGTIASEGGGPTPCNVLGEDAVRSSYQAISADGQRVYFTACPSNTTGGANEIYARVDANGTVDISNPAEEGAAECTTCSATPASAAFVGASADGSKAFFTTSQQLLNGDTDTTTDLYEYDFDDPSGKNLVQLSAGGAGDLTPGSGAEVQGVLRTSVDGSHAYFVARGVLTTVPTTVGEVAQAGADNLYAVDTETGETKFVADLCSNASESGSVGDSQCPATLNGATSEGTNDRALWNAAAPASDVQATPDGRYLVFTTYAQLITSGPEADTSGAQQAYRYDFQTGQLIRVSIGEPSFPGSDNGNTPGMNAQISSTLSTGGALADVNDWNRAISENGEYIVFHTPERLQADDTNTGANPSCEGGGTGCDVYLWRYKQHAASENQGVVSMVSDGETSTSAETEGGDAAISASGSDVFFFTPTELVGQDTDQLIDVYDARVDGGYPAPKPEPSCSGEACQGSPSSAPAFGVPGTQVITSDGNVAAPPFRPIAEAVGKEETAPSRAQRLRKKALAKCKHERPHSRRTSCERAARKRYGARKTKG